MCGWCDKKDACVIPQVCGTEFPMVCSECGTRMGFMDWKALRVIFAKATLWDRSQKENNTKGEING